MELTADPGSFEAIGFDLLPSDPLSFRVDGKSYADRLRQERQRKGVDEACIAGFCRIHGIRTVLAVLFIFSSR